MTLVLKPIADSFRLTNSILGVCLADLKQEDAKKRVRNDTGPSIAWEIGHMLDCRCKIIELLGLTKESPYGAQYGSIGATDGSDYPDLAAYSADWEQLNHELFDALEAATPESVERMVPGAVHGRQTTAFEQIVFLTWHEAYHVGAVGAIRKELGYPGPAEVVAPPTAH